MEEVYRIGNYEFATREEWEGAKRDLEMIEAILNRLDLDRSEDVWTVYDLIHDGKIEFESPLGTAFFCDISDRAAQNYKHKLRPGRQEWTKEWNEQRKLLGQDNPTLYKTMDQLQQLRETRQSRMFKFLGLSCAALALICIMFYSHSVYLENQAAKKLEEIQQQKHVYQEVDWYEERMRNAQASEVPIEETVIPEVLPEFAAMYGQYPNLAGWIRIPDTKVDLPVMKTTDNDYYLHRNIDGAEDINGTLFLDCRADIIKPSTNLIIYGHNMKSGEMFGGLKKYLEEPYLLEHSMIQFDTIYAKNTYQIIAVCLTDVGAQTEESYRYYNFINAANEEEFSAFLENIKSCAVYDNLQGVTMNDNLLTLSTCNSYVEDGRLFLVAKKIQ